MIIDFAKEDIDEQLHTKVCIVGAGVAGQTLAMSLAKAGHEPLLLESGGRDFDENVQSLSDGDVVGESYYDLDSSRLRLFGGTAAIWGGRCAELNAIDFEKRAYIPYSGWPMTKSDLRPYYDRAYETLDMKRPDSATVSAKSGRSALVFDPNRLDVGYWSFDENGERFTNFSRGNLGQVKILINATLTQMDVRNSGAVQSITVRNMGGKASRIMASVFVLAAGAIETTRLLMGTVPARPEGFGNRHDLLGRFFMEHPHARGGEIVSENLAQTLRAVPRAFRVKRHRYAAYIRIADEVQRQAGVLNSSLSLAPRRHEGDNLGFVRNVKQKMKHDLPSTRFWRSSYKSLKTASGRMREKTDPWSSVYAVKRSGGKRGLYAVIRAEQAPNPSSRVALSARKDRHGVPLAALNWQFSDQDKHSVKVLMETLRSEYQRLGWGQVIPAKWLEDNAIKWRTDPLVSAHAIGGYHHMGGTRMADVPQTGVVDANGRLFESPNLYVASSSVFPTGGWANPTLTIMALAERLGDHLNSVLSGPSLVTR